MFKSKTDPLFLIIGLCDEGISPNLVRLVESDGARLIAAYMLSHPYQWEFSIHRSLSCVNQVVLSQQSKSSVCSHNLKALATIKINQKCILEVHLLQNSESVVAWSFTRM